MYPRLWKPESGNLENFANLRIKLFDLRQTLVESVAVHSIRIFLVSRLILE